MLGQETVSIFSSLITLKIGITLPFDSILVGLFDSKCMDLTQTLLLLLVLIIALSESRMQIIRQILIL